MIVGYDGFMKTQVIYYTYAVLVYESMTITELKSMPLHVCTLLHV